MNGRVAGAGRDLAVIFAVKAAIGAWILSRGFTHVSDDDYARVVIAELFAHTPRLDPSGTSWLPLPFWIYGSAMMAFGRSLGVARAIACVLGVVALAAPYFALRGIGVCRLRATAALVLAAAGPWNAWTAVAPVPEAPAAALLAAAAIALARPEMTVFAAWCALGAALSRYEAWPLAAVIVALALRRRQWGAAAVAAAGPLGWMGWNLHAHHDALHFIARVTAFRRAAGGSAMALGDKLLDFPLALGRAAPEMAVLGAVALVSLRWPEQRGRWRLPLACAALIVLFLVYGDLRDGAPTHHPERALLGVVLVVTCFAVDGAGELAMRAARRLSARLLFAGRAAAVLALLAVSGVRWGDYPGQGEADRAAQIARGLGLRDEHRERFRVLPCAYEHFALVAAFGAPERVEIGPTSRDPVTIACPRVELP